jgi:hypothetical protein
MSKPSARRDKYFLRDLHQEIDLYDRKLAYLGKYVDFAAPADRVEAENRLRAKRAPLEKTALELAASGVEYAEKDLPRSFRTMNLERKGPESHLLAAKQA